MPFLRAAKLINENEKGNRFADFLSTNIRIFAAI
jgi:hypothetical protein